MTSLKGIDAKKIKGLEYELGIPADSQRIQKCFFCKQEKLCQYFVVKVTLNSSSVYPGCTYKPICKDCRVVRAL